MNLQNKRQPDAGGQPRSPGKGAAVRRCLLAGLAARVWGG